MLSLYSHLGNEPNFIRKLILSQGISSLLQRMTTHRQKQLFLLTQNVLQQSLHVICR